MALSIISVALKWHFLSYVSSAFIYCEYFNLFMKQLGFNTAQIGLTTLLGGLNLLIPLCLQFGEKFRAGKTMLVIVAVRLSVCFMLPLLSLIVPPLQPKCFPTTLPHSLDTTRQIVLRNASAHSKYANSKQFGSKYRRILPHFTASFHKNCIFTSTYVKKSFYGFHPENSTCTFLFINEHFCIDTRLCTNQRFIAHDIF